MDAINKTVLMNFIHWNIDPEIMTIAGFPVRYYGILFAVGLILCVWCLKRIFRKENITQEKLDTLTIYGVIGIVAGARLVHCFFYEPTYYLAHPLEVVLPVTFLPNGGIEFTGYQGLASHGGALGFLVALFFYSRRTGESMIGTADLVAVVGALAGVFIRLGNLMNSEIIGVSTSRPWGFVFERVDSVPRHPAQLYEAISYLLIFAIMVWLYTTRRDSLKNGFFFGLVLVLVFTSRFFLEFFKENQVAFEENLTFNMGQLLSLPYVLVGVGFVIYGLVKTKRDKVAAVE